MKTKDITALTEVYAVAKQWGGAPDIHYADTGVVLDTTPWVRKRPWSNRPGLKTFYRHDPDGKGLGEQSYSGREYRGLPVLVIDRVPYVDPTDELPDDITGDDPAYIEASEQARENHATVEAAMIGALPRVAAAFWAQVDHAFGAGDQDLEAIVPEHHTLRMLRPQGVIDTWAEKLDADERQKVARRADAERRAAQRNAESEAEAELLATLGGTYLMLPRNAVALLKICQRYAEAVTTKEG